jgi:hypothetical protein
MLKFFIATSIKGLEFSEVIFMEHIIQCEFKHPCNLHNDFIRSDRELILLRGHSCQPFQDLTEIL